MPRLLSAYRSLGRHARIAGGRTYGGDEAVDLKKSGY
jgi:hypothetical protein